jgi:DNA-binding beta-propeller fold protein YncE
MAFDGANVWVTNMGSNTMTQIRASDGKVLGTHPTGPKPVSVVFDGTRLWVANSGSNTVTMYQPGAPLPDAT